MKTTGNAKGKKGSILLLLLLLLPVGCNLSTPGDILPELNLVSLTQYIGVPPGSGIPGFTILESGGTSDVDEDGLIQDSYTIVLNTEPTDVVDVQFVYDDQQITVDSQPASPFTITFNPTDWYQARTITLDAVDDALVEGVHSASIQHNGSSSDNDYNISNFAQVTVNIADNNFTPQAVSFTSSTSASTNETGFLYVDASVGTPTPLDITIPLNISGSATEGTDFSISPNPLVITSGSSSATATISIQDDWMVEPDETVVVSMGTIINGNPGPITTHTATIVDDDTAGVAITPLSPTILAVVEDTTSTDFAPYSLVLTSQPQDTVTITMNFDDSQILVSGVGNGYSIDFTPSNWDQPQDLYVTAKDDLIVDEGLKSYTITHTISSPTDPDYSGGGVSVPDVTVNVSDNDFHYFAIPAPNGGDLLGIPGADLACGSDPQSAAPPHNGVFRAFLADASQFPCTSPDCLSATGTSENTANWLLKPNAQYYHDGAAAGATPNVETNDHAILKLPLTNGPLGVPSDYWTGLNPDWTAAPENCNGWTGISPDFGIIGSSTGTGTDVIHIPGGMDCGNLNLFLLCFEQP